MNTSTAWRLNKTYWGDISQVDRGEHERDGKHGQLNYECPAPAKSMEIQQKVARIVHKRTYRSAMNPPSGPPRPIPSWSQINVLNKTKVVQRTYTIEYCCNSLRKPSRLGQSANETISCRQIQDLTRRLYISLMMIL